MLIKTKNRLLQEGLIVNEVIADGVVQRVGTVDKPNKRNGFYIVNAITNNLGKTFFKVSYGNYSKGGEINHFYINPSDNDSQDINRTILNQQSKAQELRQREKELQIERIRKIAKFSIGIDNTIASKYLKNRCIYDIHIQNIYFNPSVRPKNYSKSFPALIAIITDYLNNFLGIQITYLTQEGQKASELYSPKQFLSLNGIKGGSVKLFPPMKTESEQGTILGIAEGIETALSAYKLYGIPTWSLGGIGSYSSFNPPKEVDTIHLFIDNDTNGAGQEAAKKLKKRLIKNGFKVIDYLPQKIGYDFNDVLVEKIKGVSDE